MSLLREYELNVAKGPDHQTEAALPMHPPAVSVVRAIAYYLPQFHAIAENDAWWGKGFTEWTNVTKALPRYIGHRQPRLPADLGFYDLSDPQVLRRQAELAARAGLHGFCIHDYWFDGRKVLETPLNLLLANPDIDLKFCLNWANENWSRRWDGSEADILLEQRYDPANRAGYVKSILPAIRDPRYIRIDGRPLIMVYRPSKLPDAPAMFAAWREFLMAEGEGNPYLVMAQSFSDYDPRPYGLDASAGFPPHNSDFHEDNDREWLSLLDPDFKGHARSYAWLAERILKNGSDEYRVFPGVCPGWDNEARKPHGGSAFYNATPAAYQAWLHRAGIATSAAPADERIVFINAWNEWAEGALLEPDRYSGYAYLAATRQALDALSQGAAPPEIVDIGTTTRRSTDRLKNALARRVRSRLRRTPG